jgi:hypothetical protein
MQACTQSTEWLREGASFCPAHSTEEEEEEEEKEKKK